MLLVKKKIRTSDYTIYEKDSIIEEIFDETERQRLINLGAVEEIDTIDKSSKNHENDDKKIVFLSEDEIKRFKSKSEIAEYAETIGYTLKPDEMTREEMINCLINYIEEVTENGEYEL